MGERRRAIVLLSDEIIERILDLPDGLRIVAINADFRRMGVEVMVEGDRLDPVAPATMPPTLAGEWDWNAEAQRLRWIPPWEGG
jgi:hypothetical protein